PSFLSILIGLGLAAFDCWLSIHTGNGAFAAVTASLLSILFGFFLLPFQFLRNAEKRFSAWVAARMAVPSTVPDRSWTQKDRIIGLVFGVSLLTGLAVLLRIDVNVGVLIIVPALGAYKLYPILYRRVANKVAAEINKQVVGAPLAMKETPAASPMPSKG